MWDWRNWSIGVGSSLCDSPRRESDGLACHDDVIKWKHFPRYWPFVREFPTQRPVTRSFDVFFDLCLNKRLRKQSQGWWFETLSWPLWRHRSTEGRHSVDVGTSLTPCKRHADYLNQCRRCSPRQGKYALLMCLLPSSPQALETTDHRL